MLRGMKCIMSLAPGALEASDWVWSLDPLLKRPQKLAPSLRPEKDFLEGSEYTLSGAPLASLLTPEPERLQDRI